MNDLAIKETIDEIKGKIKMNEKVTNQILGIIKMDNNAACDFATSVQFKNDVDNETKSRFHGKLCLLAVEMCIDADTPFVDLLRHICSHNEPFTNTLIEKVKARADEGNGMALYMMGCCYEEGLGVEKDAEKAYGYYLSAATTNNRWGNMAVALVAIRSIDMNFAEALFKDISEQGDKLGSWSLALMLLFNEKLTVTDKAKAIEELRNDESTMEIVEIAFIVSYCYMMGLYVEEDTKVGTEYLHITAGLVDKSTKEQGKHILDTCILLGFKLEDIAQKLRNMADDVIDYNEQPLDDYIKVLEFMLRDYKHNKL